MYMRSNLQLLIIVFSECYEMVNFTVTQTQRLTNVLVVTIIATRFVNNLRSFSKLPSALPSVKMNVRRQSRGSIVLEMNVLPKNFNQWCKVNKNNKLKLS